MPQQVIGNGFEGCESLRISYAATTAPNNAPGLEDAEGRHVLVDRADPALALKVVVEPPQTDPYDGFRVRTQDTGFTQRYVLGSYPSYTVDIVTDPIPAPGEEEEAIGSRIQSYGTYGGYTDTTVSDSDESGESTTTYRDVLVDYQYVDYYDENNEPHYAVYSDLAFRITLSNTGTYGRDGVDLPPLPFALNTALTALETYPDGRPIDWETKEVAGVWSIIVYAVSGGSDSEIARFNFDTDPQATARCNGEELCDNGCVEFVINDDGAYTCICPEEYDLPDLGPPRPEPDSDLEVHPKEALHRRREPLKQQRRNLAKAEADYRATLGQIGQKEQAVNDAISQGNSAAEATAKKELEELVGKGSKQANDYQNLKLDNERDSVIEKDLIDAEKTSDTTVVPTADGSRYPRFTSGTIRPTINSPTINQGVTISPTVTGVTIAPTINSPTINQGVTIGPTITGTTIAPTINQGITISPTITTPTIRGGGINL
jgi:hypothetical protein